MCRVVHIPFVCMVELKFPAHIPVPTQSCLALYFFCANLLHLVIMWLIVSSLSPHSLHSLFCCVLSILALIWWVFTVLWLVLMALWLVLNSLRVFSEQRKRTFFHCSERKSFQFSRTLLSILADLNNVVVCMISACSLISKSSGLVTRLFCLFWRAPIITGINMFLVHWRDLGSYLSF